MSDELHEKIREMRDADVNIGSRVEIIMKQGAEWDNGWNPPQGYKSPGEGELFDQPGRKTIGYVGKYEDDSVILAPVWGETRGREGPIYDGNAFFVDADVIYSFTRLKG